MNQLVDILRGELREGDRIALEVDGVAHTYHVVRDLGTLECGPWRLIVTDGAGLQHELALFVWRQKA